MSVINSWGATPNRMRIALKFVSGSGQEGMTNEAIQQTLLPAALAGSQSDDEPQGGSAIGTEVISELRNLGLLIQTGDGCLRVSSDAINVSDDGFVQLLQDRLIYPAEADNFGQGAFPRALAWFLCQDPASPLLWGENHRNRVESDCGTEGGAFELTNSAGCNQFIYWARFLGFAWRLNIEKQNVVIPDPTRSIAREMGRWEATTDWQPIGEVLSRLANRLPVLEGGAARTEIESRLGPEKQRAGELISRSTTFALRRLERSGQIQMERTADALALNLDFGAEPRAVSHIRWTGPVRE